MAKTGWRTLIVPGVFAIAALIVLVSLGNWQMRRTAWKETVNAKIESRIGAEPVSIEDLLGRWRETGDVEYVPVRIEGRFHHDKERHLVATRSGVPGWHVYTPLARDDGTIVFVNRGFVPAERKAASTRTAGQVSEPVSLTGLARNPPSMKPNSMIPDHDPQKNVYTWRDFKAMTADAGLSGATLIPFFVEVHAGKQPSAGPRGGVTRVTLENKHFGYALTWYGLALTLIGVFVAFAMSRLKFAPKDADVA